MTYGVSMSVTGHGWHILYIYMYMPLVHFVWFKTTLRKTFWPYMKILSKKHQFTPSRVNDASISHLIHTSISFSTLISLIPLFFYFIHLYFTIFCFISFPFASFRYILYSFRFHFASFRFISHHFASFRILIGPLKMERPLHVASYCPPLVKFSGER